MSFKWVVSHKISWNIIVKIVQIAQKLNIYVKIHTHDRAIIWGSFKKHKHANKLLQMKICQKLLGIPRFSYVTACWYIFYTTPNAKGVPRYIKRTFRDTLILNEVSQFENLSFFRICIIYQV